MSISEKLNTISTSLSDIKDAIIDKGQTPSGNITTYAEAISNISGGGQTINNQNKTVTTNGVYTADAGYTGLGEVTVDVPQSGIVPTGTITITNNGTTNVSQFEYADVQLSGSANLGTKTITSNGTYSASSDSLDGFSEVTVNVSGGGSVLPVDTTIKNLIEGTLSGNITLDNSITKINSYAFAEQINMAGLTAQNVTTIGRSIFYSYNNDPLQITEINLPNYVGPTLDETTGQLVVPQGSNGITQEASNLLPSDLYNLQSVNIPNLTIIPRNWNYSGSSTFNLGNIIGVCKESQLTANTLNVNPLNLKYLECAISSFSNTNFNYNNLDQYAVNGVLSLPNLLSGSGIFDYVNIPSTSTIDKIYLPSLKNVIYNESLMQWFNTEKDMIIDIPNITSIGNNQTISNYCNYNNNNKNITIIMDNCTTIGQSILATFSYLKSINVHNCTTLGDVGYNALVVWSNVDEIDLGGVTTIHQSANIGFDNSTIGYLDLSSLQNASSIVLTSSTITTLDLQSATLVGDSLMGATSITNLLLGGNSVVTGGNNVANVTNIYVPDTLVSAYEADSYWSQYPQGTIKPMSDWTAQQAQ